MSQTAINAQRVLYTLSDRNPFVIIFLLDCCREYHLRNPDVDGWNRSVLGKSSLIRMDKAGSLIAFACAAGTVAMDGKGQRNGLFTKHLVKHIITPNEDIQMVLRRVRREVKEESKSQQIPFVSDGLLDTNICLSSQVQRKY